MLKYLDGGSPFVAGLIVSLLFPAMALSSPIASFTPLVDPGGGVSSQARGISADGQVVVGDRTGAAVNTEAFYWTGAGGMVGLGYLTTTNTLYSTASAVSANGSVIVGYGARPDGDNEAFRWTQAGGLQQLGDLPGGAFYSQADGVSPDGLTVVGHSSVGVDIEGFRWTQASGMQGVGFFSDADPNNRWSKVTGVTAGGMLVGGATHAEGFEAFRMTGGGSMEGLGKLSGTTGSLAFAVSADGSVIVGHCDDEAVGNRAFIWTSGVGMEGLGDLPDGGWSTARAVSADGSIVVGDGDSGDNNVAFIWDRVHGIRVLQDVLTSDYGLGSELTGWVLNEAAGISADGKIIVGCGINPDGNTQAWVVQIPEPATMAMLGLGAVAMIVRKRR